VGIRQNETYDERELNEYQRKHAWFVGFAPADQPEIVLAVLVENGGGGSAVAAPVVRQVIDAYLHPSLVAR
jgi:penicillin-binding protein 2